MVAVVALEGLEQERQRKFQRELITPLQLVAAVRVALQAHLQPLLLGHHHLLLVGLLRLRLPHLELNRLEVGEVVRRVMQLVTVVLGVVVVMPLLVEELGIHHQPLLPRGITAALE
jgi:hypothetical protein